MADESDGGRETHRSVGVRSHAFLLRCWQEPGSTPDGVSAWRFSLTDIEAGRQKKGFATLEALMAYLWQVLQDMNCSTLEGEQS